MHSELLLEKKFPTGQRLNHGAWFFHLSVLIFPLIKDQVRHITLLRVYLSKNRFDSGSTKLEVAGSTPRVEAQERTHSEKLRKQRKEI